MSDSKPTAEQLRRLIERYKGVPVDEVQRAVYHMKQQLKELEESE